MMMSDSVQNFQGNAAGERLVGRRCGLQGKVNDILPTGPSRFRNWPLKAACSKDDPGSPSGFPDHATLFLCAAPEQFESAWQNNRSADFQTGAARGIINYCAIEDRLSWRDDDLGDPGYLSGRSNSCKSARMNHLKILLKVRICAVMIPDLQ
jgi:hypothetical protein